MDSTDVIRMLHDDGWELVRVRGSHHHFKHPTKPAHPEKDTPKGTLNNIRKQAGLK